MKVLITGGAGFIGSQTANALVGSGHEVRILDVLHPQIHGEGADFPSHLDPAIERIRGDVRNREDVAAALDGVEAVCHCAAHTGVGQSMYDLREYTDVNCTGTAALLETIMKERATLKRFVLSSSRAVYGEGAHQCPRHGQIHPPQRGRTDLEQGRFDMFCPECGGVLTALPTREDAPARPVSVYAWTKQQQEDLCQYAAATFKIPVTILRYFNVYGEGQSLKNPYTGVVSIFYSRLMAGQPISIYERGVPLRDFVHVSDVVRANVTAIERPVTSGTCINIGAGAATSIQQVAELLGRITGRPASFLDRGEFRVGDIHTCYADIARARDLLGFLPRVSLEDGLARFATWARGKKSVDDYQKTVDELRAHGLFGAAEERKSA